VFTSVAIATKRAQEMAELRNVECVVYDAKAGKEIAKYVPELAQVSRKPRQKDSI
jgi:hypothetical protein